MNLQKYSFVINSFSILRGDFPINEKLTISHLNLQFPPVFSGKATSGLHNGLSEYHKNKIKRIAMKHRDSYIVVYTVFANKRYCYLYNTFIIFRVMQYFYTIDKIFFMNTFTFFMSLLYWAWGRAC